MRQRVTQFYDGSAELANGPVDFAEMIAKIFGASEILGALGAKEAFLVVDHVDVTLKTLLLGELLVATIATENDKIVYVMC